MTHPTPDAEPTLDLAAILARADAATPGPWVAAGTEIKRVGPTNDDITAVVADYEWEGGGVERRADATFIAAARTDVPALVDALRVRDDEIAALRADRDALAERVRELEEALEKILAGAGSHTIHVPNEPLVGVPQAHTWYGVYAIANAALARRKGEG